MSADQKDDLFQEILLLRAQLTNPPIFPACFVYLVQLYPVAKSTHKLGYLDIQNKV